MKRARMITTENCCSRTLSALHSICKSLKEVGNADETDLSYKLNRLHLIINEKKDYHTTKVISETLCEIYSTILDNEQLATYFYNDNFIFDFATRFRNLELPYEYRERISEKIDNFLTKSRDTNKNIDMILSIAANAGSLCDELEQCRLRIEYYRNLNILNSAAIYFAIINNLIDMDDKTLFRLKALCNEVKKSPLAETATLKNPVYVLLNLYQIRCIDSLNDFNELLENNNMFLMVTKPAVFDAENFKAQWWKLLAEPQLQERIGRNRRNATIIINRMEEYRDNCFGSNITIYNYIIDGLATYSRLAR